MNSYRYLIAKYKPNEENKSPINIGIIIQSDDQITCKFIPDVKVLDKVKSSAGQTDKFVFENMGKTLQERFAEKTLTITDPTTREKKDIHYTDSVYLDYLCSNFLNNYIFGDRGVIQSENINDGLEQLYSKIVFPS
jgi:hypothetical protein